MKLEKILKEISYISKNIQNDREIVGVSSNSKEIKKVNESKLKVNSKNEIESLEKSKSNRNLNSEKSNNLKSNIAKESNNNSKDFEEKQILNNPKTLDTSSNNLNNLSNQPDSLSKMDQLKLAKPSITNSSLGSLHNSHLLPSTSINNNLNHGSSFRSSLISSHPSLIPNFHGSQLLPSKILWQQQKQQQEQKYSSPICSVKSNHNPWVMADQIQESILTQEKEKNRIKR